MCRQDREIHFDIFNGRVSLLQNVVNDLFADMIQSLFQFVMYAYCLLEPIFFEVITCVFLLLLSS